MELVAAVGERGGDGELAELVGFDGADGVVVGVADFDNGGVNQAVVFIDDHADDEVGIFGGGGEREVAGGGSRLNDAGSGGCLRGGQGQVRLPDGQVGEVFFGKEERFEFDEGSLGCNWFAWG